MISEIKKQTFCFSYLYPHFLQNDQILQLLNTALVQMKMHFNNYRFFLPSAQFPARLSFNKILYY
jgi:hypothetical protein